MGRKSYCLTFISDGQWICDGSKWVFKGNKTTKALVVSEGITYRSLRGKLEEKIDLNRKRYEMELKYLTPGRPNLPPLVVNDDDDLEAFMFLNCQANDAIWPIELYANLKEKGDQEFTKVEYGKQQINEAEIAVFPSPPPVTQSQEAQAMMRDQPYGDCNISVTNNTSAHLDRNLIDCDLFETKPLNVEGNTNKKGKEKFIDLVSQSEEESEHVDLDSESDDSEEAWSSDFQDPFVDDNDDVEHYFIDVDEEVLQEIETKYYRTNKSSQMQMDNNEEPKDDEEVDLAQLEIKVGVYFNSKKQLKDRLSLLAVQRCFQMHVEKSDKNLYVVKCVDPHCSFFCLGSKFRQTGLFLVRKFCGEHTCGMKIKHNHHKHASSSIIADHVMSSFNAAAKGKGLRAAEIQDLMKKMGVNASYNKENRACLTALDGIRGTTEQAYKRLHAYFHMLEKINPGTITHIELDAKKRFKFCFFSLGASRRGFPFLRKVISVDGTSLNSKYKGVLLLALAQDANKQIYPLAFALVDSENDNSWSYFFRQLRQVVPDENDVIFVSDRHGSIIKGLRDNYVFSKHGYCTLHLFQNVKTSFKRSDLWGLYQKTNKAYTKQEFNQHYANIFSDSPEVGTYLKDVGFQTWARSHFPANRYNTTTINNAECFNNVVKEARGWPVIGLIDGILSVVIRWFYKRREMGQNCVEVLTLTICKELEVNYLGSLTMVVTRINQFEFQVHSGGTTFLINLHARTCYCNAFQVDQIPCPHSIAAAKDIGVDLVELVHPFFKADKWKEVYKETEYPAPPFDRWEVPDAVMNITCLPPVVKRRIGRPRKNRIPSRGEYKGRKRRCGSCNTLGHNKRNCPNPSTSAAAP